MVERDDAQRARTGRSGEQFGGLGFEHPQFGGQTLRVARHEAAHARRQPARLTDLARPRMHLGEHHAVEDAHVVHRRIQRREPPHETLGLVQGLEDLVIVLRQGPHAGQQADLLDALPVEFRAGTVAGDHCFKREIPLSCLPCH